MGSLSEFLRQRRAFASRGVRRLLPLLVAAAAALTGLSSMARETPEDKAWTAASNEFNDRQFSQADVDFTAFLAAYTNSPHLADAALCKAQAQSMQSNYSGAINTLQTYLPHAGQLAPDYVFYIAQATNALGHYDAAATGFANLIKEFPQSPLLLEAAYDEASARSKMNQWERVIDLLAPTNAAFQRASHAPGANPEFAATGQLLLAKAYLEHGPAPAGEAALRNMPPNLRPELAWEKAYLLCQLQLLQNDAAGAAATATNMVALARPLGPARLAMSLALRGDVFERQGNLAAALECYTNNLAPENLPDSIQRESLTKALPLLFRLGQTNTVVQWLDDLAQRPHFGAMDLVRLQIGELCLAAAAPDSSAAPIPLLGTNLLQRAGTNFADVLREFPDSPLSGRAHLDYGWRLWLDTNVAGARTNFADAVRQLPHSEDQAVARFKLADADFTAKDFAGALTNYNQLLRDYAGTPSVTNKLFDLALYKIIEASLAIGDETQATNAAAKILAWFPTSYYGQYGGLLLGQDLTRKNDYALARREFAALTNQPTPLAARAAFAIARTYGFEGDWPDALKDYNQWVENYAKDPLLPEVEFERALACDKAGQESNALLFMTNFVSRFASNHLAPWAQNWIADFYYNLGDYPKAEINYQELYDKWPNSEGDLAYRARFMAGKAAFLRQDPGEAQGYFTNLINLPNTPPAIRNEAYSALADAIYQQDPTNTRVLSQAIAAESKLTNGAPTNASAAPAFGRMGDFFFQGKDYAGAKQMYTAALACDLLDKDTRCQAEIGLGNTALMLQQTNDALLHFNTVLYHIDDPGSFWMTQAGQAAGAVLENLGQWEAAKNVYQRVLNAVPASRPVLERKISVAQENMDAAPNKE